MSNKRQRRSSPLPITTNEIEYELVFVEAHETQLIYRNEELASKVEGKCTEIEGGRMQKWSGTRFNGRDDEEIWIDRYDILNLLDTIPSLSPSSPIYDIGFEDLPEEELFYFDSVEREDINRKKKKRMMEEGRLERIRAREEEDRLEEEARRLENEPSEDQLALMHKLHSTLSNSPDPSLLEMRILANHGVDPRFSFLRKGGKFRDVWEKIRSGELVDKEKEVEVVKESGSLLVAYASDSEEEEEEAKVVAAEDVVVIETEVKVEETETEKLKKKAKAEKAKQWARNRKEAREGKE